jgi:lipoprotein signal peptidase
METIQQTQTKIGTQQNQPLVDATLTLNQTRALEEFIQQLDGNAPRRTVALLGPHGSGKSTLIVELLESPRPRRTTLKRRVLGFVADASLLDTRITPWIQLVNSVLDKLTDLAQPTPPMMIADLKTELRELARLENRNDEAAKVTSDLASAAFAHHWRSAFPRLILDIVMQNNATFVVALDHLERIEPVKAMQLMEAAQYFLGAPGCTTLLLADEASLINHLDQSEAGADGAAMLRKWASARVALKSSNFGKPITKAIARNEAIASPITKTNTGPTDVPAPVLQTLSATGHADEAVTHWRAAMRAIMRRAQDGQPITMSGELMAKVIALRYQAQALFNSARMDAGLLVGLERRIGNPRMAEVGNEFDTLVAADENLKTLLKSQPMFGSVEVRDLATALRLAFSEEAANSLVMEAAAEMGNTGTSRSTLTDLKRTTSNILRSVASTATAATEAIPSSWVNIGTAVATAISLACGLFILDRLIKLLMLSAQTALGGLLQLDVNALLPATNDLANSGASIAAEMVGIGLATLIFLFWGRNHKLHSAALGLIIGGMAANLIDHVAYGAVLNYIHLGQLPAFNLAHVGLLMGGALLLVSMLRNGFVAARTSEG